MDLSSGLLILLIAPECFTPLRELGSGFHASENGREARSRAQTLLSEAEASARTQTESGTRRPTEERSQHVVYGDRSEEHTSELQSRFDLVCRLLLEKKKYKTNN